MDDKDKRERKQLVTNFLLQKYQNTEKIKEKPISERATSFGTVGVVSRRVAQCNAEVHLQSCFNEFFFL